MFGARGKNPHSDLSRRSRPALSRASGHNAQGSRTPPAIHLERQLPFAARGRPRASPGPLRPDPPARVSLLWTRAPCLAATALCADLNGLFLLRSLCQASISILSHAADSRVAKNTNP